MVERRKMPHDARNGTGETSIALSSVSDGNRTLRLKSPISIEVIEDASTGFLLAEYVPLTISAYGSTRQEITEQITDQLFFLWDQYVLEETHPLSGDAQDLKANLLSHLEEIAGAEA